MTEKVSFYTDKKSWEKFKDHVYRSSGTMRNLSSELNKIIDDNTLINLEDNLKRLITSKEIQTFSLEEIKQDRPTVPISAEEIIREMRKSHVNLS
ncbi:MAG: hypothetical protein JSU57_03120 [Candidatus Heimdallarchaeota archaeon]|nr:MAG: hypothetical protein JSU57_03120 [Candidatus Heimdallarchaeota archaeon]